MYHGITYADEAYSEGTKGKMSVRLWRAVMRNGLICFDSPEKCVHRTIKEMDMKTFEEKLGNFAGVDVTGGECDGLDESSL